MSCRIFLDCQDLEFVEESEDTITLYASSVSQLPRGRFCVDRDIINMKRSHFRRPWYATRQISAGRRTRLRFSDP
ncbi:hypothetical protein ABKN59_006995 [Abortiporus biennis]